MSVETAGTVAWAAALAERYLAVLGDRWQHTKAVAARAEGIAYILPREDQAVLVMAAWLHDLGYAPDLQQTGFHPIDGARYLESLGAAPRLCAMVAHHSGAAYEADQRGLSGQLARYPREDGPALEALVYADMTTGPQGQTFEFDQRIDEILRRYPPGHPVNRAIVAARTYLGECVRRTMQRLEGQPR